MIWILATLPFMLLALAIATVPLIWSMVRQQRRSTPIAAPAPIAYRSAEHEHEEVLAA